MHQTQSTFNTEFENNTKVYLRKCLSFAHLNNKQFQKEMKDYFHKYHKNCKYSSAPVKIYDRCVIKATSDYGMNHFPSSSHILDFMRFSVCYDSVNDLLIGLNMFIDDINNNVKKIHCLKQNGILRIKNGFTNTKTKWKSVSDAEYSDIKLNIVFMSNKHDCNHMIVEAQFLVLFFCYILYFVINMLSFLLYCTVRMYVL